MHNSNEFIKLEIIGAYLLLSATVLAFILSNTPWYDSYHYLFSTSYRVHLSVIQFPINLTFFINDILMVFFFLIAGLEIKFEFLHGSLNTLSKAILPIIAAMGGMIVPAGIYILLNYHNSILLKGWAVPIATDIAFSLGVLSLLGSRVKSSLKIFLMALAIIDDLLAIIIIAFFYTNHLSLFFLILSLICLIILFFMNKKEVAYIVLYLIVGIFLWFCLFFAGIHPTLTGVAVAFAIPLSIKNSRIKSPLHQLKKLLHPFVALGVLPLFAFVNSGISIFHMEITSLHSGLILGILFGLFFGKQLGICGSSWIAIKLKIAQLPEKVRWLDFYALSVMCGIGFTISLFIGTLAFGEMNTSYIDSLKIGVLLGSLLSGIIGYILLRYTFNKI